MNDEVSETEVEKLSVEELAQGFVSELSKNGYNLTDKVGVSRALRKLLRQETEQAQKQAEETQRQAEEAQRQAEETQKQLAQLIEVL